MATSHHCTEVQGAPLPTASAAELAAFDASRAAPLTAEAPAVWASWAAVSAAAATARAVTAARVLLVVAVKICREINAMKYHNEALLETSSEYEQTVQQMPDNHL